MSSVNVTVLTFTRIPAQAVSLMNVPLRQSVGTLSLLPVQVTFKASVIGLHAGVTDTDDETISDTTNVSADSDPNAT
jgi:hypothetical protein